MLDAAVIVSLVAALIAGAIVGAVGVLSLIAVTIHRTASQSILTPKWPALSADELKLAQGDELALGDLAEASDALQSERERTLRVNGGYGGLWEGRAAPTRDFSARSSETGCGWCKRLRKAVLGHF